MQLRGRVSDDRQREALENFARARFGSATVYGATRVDAALPSGWPVRTMAALEALHELAEGVVSVRPDLVKIRGISGNPAASDQIARILADRLGESAQIELAVRYDKRVITSYSIHYTKLYDIAVKAGRWAAFSPLQRCCLRSRRARGDCMTPGAVAGGCCLRSCR